MKYKTEPHIHLSEVSPCARLPAHEMIRLYAEAGYHTVFISDHLHRNCFARFGDIPWREKIARFASGYEAARAAGGEYGITVLFSAELTLERTPGDYLLYGMDPAFLEAREDLFDLTIGEFYQYAKAHGVTVVRAHPFRESWAEPENGSYMDAVEVYNGSPRHENHTDRALAFAGQYHLPMTAGSDAHRREDVALSGVLTDTPIKSAEDYVRLLLDGRLSLIADGGVL